MNETLKNAPVTLEVMQAHTRVIANLGIVSEGTCSTAAGTAAKTVTLGTAFKLENKATLLIKFTNGISVANSTLAITHTTLAGTEITETAKPIYLNGAALDADVIPAGATVILRYNGTQFEIVGGAGGSGVEGSAFYTPTLSSAPTSSTTTYVREGKTVNFEIGQFCRIADASSDTGYKFYQLHDIDNGSAVWIACAMKMAPTVTAPQASSSESLVYDGTAKALISAGSSNDGTLKYSLDGSTWGTSVPTVTNAGTYTVYWKLEGDGIHSDIPATSITVTLAPKEVSSPTIILSDDSYTYDGSACTPDVTVKDGDDTISSSEYTVQYSDNVNAGTATVTIIDKTGGNYNVSGSTTFTISKASGSVTTAPINRASTYNGNAQPVADAGVGTGTMMYRLGSEGDFSSSMPTVTNAGTYTLYYYAAESSNYEQSSTNSISVTIINADVTYVAPTVLNLTYTGEAQNLISAGNVTHGTLQYSTDGENWSTTIPSQTNAGTYTSYWKIVGDANYNDIDSTSVSTTIAKVTPTLVAPTAASGLTYNGNAQNLLSSAGSVDFGTLQYSKDNSNWGTSIPQETNAGTYTVYYRVVGDSNINDIAASSYTVAIAKANPTYTAPTAKTLTYNGSAQDLLNAGSTNDGTFKYSSDGTNWSTSIPQSTNASDSITVYWKLEGDANHTDVAATSISVSIAKATPTYTAPTAKTGLTYNGLAQELINAGSTNFGTLKYSIGVQQTVVNNNNHAYVDLGLPSGTLWATMNVGANAPEDYGNYYKYGLGASPYDNSQTDYTGTENPLSLSLDTARQVWNGNWHQPTKTQYEELLANTTYEWTTINGINGGKFTAQNGNYVFFPAAGSYYGGSQGGVGRYGFYWSSSPYYNTGSVYFFGFYDGREDVDYEGRGAGYSVRGVIEPSTIIVPSTYSTSIPTGVNAGTYYVYWKIEGDDNINEVSGSTAIEVTISKINSTITMSGNSTTMLVGNTNTPTITVNGGAPATITSSNVIVAMVSGYTISSMGSGTTTITVSTPTDDNHIGDTKSYTLTVTVPDGVYAVTTSGNEVPYANIDTSSPSSYVGVSVKNSSPSMHFFIDKRFPISTPASASICNCKPWANPLRNNTISYMTAISGDEGVGTALRNTANSAYNDGQTGTYLTTQVCADSRMSSVSAAESGFIYARSINNPVTNAKNGYLGSVAEWFVVIDNITMVNNIMNAIGGVELVRDVTRSVLPADTDEKDVYVFFLTANLADTNPGSKSWYVAITNLWGWTEQQPVCVKANSNNGDERRCARIFFPL